MATPNRKPIRLLTAAFALALASTAIPMQAQEVVSPCPEVIISQRVDHTPHLSYRLNGWDTVVTCATGTIELTAEPYIPVQKFNGTYTVEQVPYNPPDTTFSLGTRMPISTDDNFASGNTDIPYPFYFFGIRQNKFCLGANGLVTFNTDYINSGRSCPWSYSAGIPWPDGTTGAPSETSCMRNAIYGIYEDTYPSPSIHTSGASNWGIYYGIQDEFPCRKIICSWNDVPQYSCTSLRCTYQIVCYEGSNIIEVHVKQREVCNSWNSGNGIIGIQNATGTAQQPDPSPSAPNHWVVSGSPAAFFPTGYNPTHQTLHEVAFRFTPQGLTSPNTSWYRIFDDGRPDVELSSSPLGLEDTNVYGYCTAIDINNPLDPTHPTRTTAVVRPKVPAKYMLNVTFRNAAGDIYRLYDTISIGVDTANDLRLRTLGDSYNNEHCLDICQGDEANLELVYPELQSAQRTNYHVTRVLNGVERELPSSIYRTDATGDHFTLLPDDRADTLPANKIDTIKIQSAVDFISGCFNYDTSMIRIFPNFDTTEVAGICAGQTYVWHLDGQSYTQTTNAPTVHLQSQPGCDSTVHLDLTVFATSITIDTVEDCKAFTWMNGKTYTQTNTASNDHDTVVLPNIYGCDSIVKLHFTMRPLEARIHSSLDHFDFDHLDVELTDVSIGDTTRRWLFPSGTEQTGATAFYSIPVSEDSADISLIAYSPYGCIDTTHIVLNLNKESFWVPNIFTPDSPQGNNLFGSVSYRTIKQEMIIYNRRGEKVYQCNGPDCKWDGRDLSGAPCPQGAYVYIIRFTNEYEPHITQTRKGTVTLLR